MVARGREKLPSILGTPASGEIANGETFDGETEVATFPGDLPADPEELFTGDAAFRGLSSASAEKADFRFLRFRPPQLERDGASEPRAASHPPRPRPPVPDRRQTAMSEQAPHRRPATFKLDDPGVVVMDPDDVEPAVAAARFTSRRKPTPRCCRFRSSAPIVPVRRGFRWGAMFWSALGGLVMLGVGLGVTRLIEDLFARSESLG